MAFFEPQDVDTAFKHLEWRAAMEEELKMIYKNETWKLVDRPCNKNVIGVKWVFKLKYNADAPSTSIKQDW